MKCLACVEEGERSTVTEDGSTTTLMAWQAFWDEDGNHHTHDPNITSTRFFCSRGHAWTDSREHPCGACGYKPMNHPPPSRLTGT